MALPQTANPASPADADSPAQGAAKIRGVLQYLVDVVGVPNNSAVTAMMGTLTTAGVYTVSQSPFTVPTLIQGTASQVLRIGSQYSNIGFEINAATVMNLNATGMLMQTPWVEWPSGVTAFLGTQGNQPLAVRTNAANRLTVLGGGNVGVGTSAPTTLLHTSGTAYSTTLDANTLSIQSVGPHAIGGATNSIISLLLTGSGASASNPEGVRNSMSLTAGSGGTTLAAIGRQTGNTITTAAAAFTLTDAAGLILEPPTLTLGAGSAITNASTLKITAAPTGATNNYPLWVAGAGDFTRFDSGLRVTTAGGLSFTAGPQAALVDIGGGLARFGSVTGTGASIPVAFLEGNTERMRISSGILLLGVTNAQGVAAGTILLPNARYIAGTNAAGNQALGMMQINASNLPQFGFVRTGAAVAANFTADFFLQFQDSAGNNFYIPGRNASW